MNKGRVNPLFDDLLDTGLLVAIGLNSSFVPDWLSACTIPLWLIILAALIFVRWKRKSLPREEQQDLKRAETDERNLMIREKAAWMWIRVEYWLMLGMFWAVGVIFHRSDIAYTIYWISIIHWFGLVAARWWLSRKY